MDRRGFLRAAAVGAAGAALGGCDTKLLNLLNSGEERLWGMNVHPYPEPLRSAQIEALRAMGVRRIRITLGLHEDLASPYLGGYSADYLGILNDFRDPYPEPNSWPTLVRRALRRAPGVTVFEVLNEPVGIPARDYVERYLKPAYDIIKAVDPALRVAAAAPTSTSGGRTWFYQMTDAGADGWCDFRCVHLYQDNAEIYLKGTDRPFLVTESGVQDQGRHVDWWSSTMAHISGILETERLYWYVLADSPDTAWGVISSRSRAGQIGVLSPLYGYVAAKYGPGARTVRVRRGAAPARLLGAARSLR